MNIVFTICSNNYLSYAALLAFSTKKHNPNITFVIGLVDEIDNNSDYSFLGDVLLLPVKDIGLLNLDELWKKYTIVELNTSVKASYFKYLFNHFTEAREILYIDPDIFVYQSLSPLFKYLEKDDIILTPHVLTPIPLDGESPSENFFLNYGIFNLGFIGLNRNCYSNNGFLDWWEERIHELGFIKLDLGLFTDQLWINFASIYFDKVKIIRDLGCNVARWNLHERNVILDKNSIYRMNDNSPLYFFHFSSYKYNSPNVMSKYYTRYNFETHPLVKKLYDAYREGLILNKVEYWSMIPCVYVTKRANYLNNLPQDNISFISKVNQFIKRLLPPIVLDLKYSLFK